MRISKFLFDRVLHEGLGTKVLKPEKVTPPQKKSLFVLVFFLFLMLLPQRINESEVFEEAFCRLKH